MKPAPEQFRLTPESNQRLKMDRRLESTAELGNNGMFFIPFGREVLRCMISDGEGWEHVSVSLRHRTPTWDEMCFVKSQFWDDEECVMQLHPRKSEYVNWHPYCLHLWRPLSSAIPEPPSIFVGPKT